MKYFIAGGTGTLGNAVICQLLKNTVPPEDITVFSRDELKQAEMAAILPDIRYELGDIRDEGRVHDAMSGHTYVFNFAALKRIDTIEKNPIEGIKTNLIGAINVAESAKSHGVFRHVFSCTDKAVLSITAYGDTKALAAKCLTAMNGGHTTFINYNWGNVLGSRGSVIPLFIRKLQRGEKVGITHQEMTRFWIRIEDAARYMVDTFREATGAHTMIPDMKAASLMRVLDATAKVMGVADYETEIIGIRGTEKIHECLISSHDQCVRSDTCPQYTDMELMELIEPIVRAN